MEDTKATVTPTLPVSPARFGIYGIIIIAAMGGLLFGFGTAIISGAIIFIKQAYQLKAFNIEIVVGAVLLGAAIGAIAIGKISDRYGRRNILIATALWFALGSFLSAIAANVVMIIVGRFIVGIAIGVSSFVVPLYISEIAPESQRGMLVIINTIAVTSGILIAYIVGYGLSFSHSWRWMFGLGIIPAVAMAIGLCFLPRSPRWLVCNGLLSEAERVLKKIRNSLNIAEELENIKHTISCEKKQNWRDLCDPMLKPVFIVCIGLAIIQQIGGINVIFYYAPHIFSMTGFHNTSGQMLATISLGVINLVGTVIAFRLVDKFGRRQLLITGLIGMTLSLAVLAFSLNFTGNLLIAYMALICLVVYVGFYALSVGCLFWLIAAEVFPLNVRGKSMSVVTAINWSTSLLLSITFLNLIQMMGISGAFWLYSVLNFLGLIFCYYMVPETKGISLEKIEENLRAGKPARELGLNRELT